MPYWVYFQGEIYVHLFTYTDIARYYTFYTHTKTLATQCSEGFQGYIGYKIIHEKLNKMKTFTKRIRLLSQGVLHHRHVSEG